MKQVLFGLAALALTSTSGAASQADMVVACTQTAHDYAWYLDHPDQDLNVTAAKFAQLFTENATLKLANMQMQLVEHRGHEEIAARYKQGRDTFRFLHMLSNQRIIPTTDTTAIGTSYVQFIIHPIGEDMTHEFGVRGVAEYRSTFEFVDGTCRFSHREGLARFINLNPKIVDPIPE